MMESIREALNALDEIKESLFTHCKNSNLKDNQIELNAVLKAYDEMFDKISYELKEYDKHSDLIWNIKRGIAFVADKDDYNTMFQLNKILRRCFKIVGKDNSLIICDTPNPEELKLLLDNGYKEDK